MKGYSEIFNKRGKSYHAAMQLAPNARDEEFLAAVAQLNGIEGSTILDVPAGGGYLERYLPENSNYLGLEFSQNFSGHSQMASCREDQIDQEEESVDEVVSLAALHHMTNRGAFYQEIHRVLKPNGTFIIGDGLKEGLPARFLNGFVDQWNSMGHQGDFLDPELEAERLRANGFRLLRSSEQEFFWNFSSLDEAVQFFRLLFYLDRDPPRELIEKQLAELGLSSGSKGIQVSWSLTFVVATKD